MEYIGTIYRPPSEANSLIIQATIGCSSNTCAFCSMYKNQRFKIREINEIKADLLEIKPPVSRIFLCDGNAFVMETEALLSIAACCHERFPQLERITSYALPGDILQKSEKELKALHEAGFKMLYLGLESGSDKVLQKMGKGASRQDMIDCARKLKPSGIALSVMAITGLGGQELMEEHAIETASALSAMEPEFVGLLALMVDSRSKLHEYIANGNFTLLTPQQVVEEMLIIIQNLFLSKCFFSSVHASNYISLRGTFPQDKEKLIAKAKQYLQNGCFRNENLRRL